MKSELSIFHSKIAWLALADDSDIREICDNLRKNGCQGLTNMEIFSSGVMDAINNLLPEEREELMKNQDDVSSAITSNLQDIVSQHGERLVESSMSKLRAEVASIKDLC